MMWNYEIQQVSKAQVAQLARLVPLAQLELPVKWENEDLQDQQDSEYVSILTFDDIYIKVITEF